MTIEEIKILKESEHKVEFKEAQTQYNFKHGRKSILGYVIALANEEGGKLILGVKENKSGPHQIVGSKAWENEEGKLEQDIYREKQIRVRIEVLHENGNRVLIIHVPSRPVGKTIKFEDVPLMRVGDELLPMSDEQVLKILQEQEPDFSAKICAGLKPEDLDAGAISKMKGKYADKQKNPSFSSKENQQVLSDLKLSDNGNLTYAALLLLGKREAIQRYLPQACVTWEFRFSEGQINNDFREIICLPLFLAIEAIWRLINSKNGSIQVRVNAYINELPVFNEEVIREAVLNAIAHRDYSVTSEVVIRQYPRKMIINNPGGFPKGVTIDNLLTISSTPRSRLMAEVLEKTGLVERSGQGVDKIFSFTLSEGKPEPSYKNSDMFQVSLNLSGVLEDTAFHIFLNEAQKLRGPENLLSAEHIIALYKVKTGQYVPLKAELLVSLEREGLILKVAGHTNRYILPNQYYQLASKEQRIGKRYITSEIEQFLTVLQGNILKIGDLEKALIGSLNRNQIKYMVNKLFEDGIIDVEGAGRGTKYKISSAYTSLKGGTLMNAVVGMLREKYA
jgi:ATP-dependent DNA helicase RecG